ncbi:MAG: glyoxylate/hydroxypyruvate reductase A [Myxococcota bacterium]
MTPEERSAARVAIVANPDPQALEELPKLEWVQSLWAGVERLLTEVPRKNLPVVRMTDPHLADTMAEAVLAWTWFLHRDAPRYLRQQREAIWRPHPVVPAQSRKVGVLGLGHLGRAAATRLRDNGFQVIGWSRRPRKIDRIVTRHGPDGLTQLLNAAEILVVLLPLTAQTDGLLDTPRFEAMPAGASLINFARGRIIDDHSLIASLDGGHLCHAVLDVFAEEPLPAGHPYWTHPSVTVLPHVAAPTNRDTASTMVNANLERFIDRGDIPAAVSRARGY